MIRSGEVTAMPLKDVRTVALQATGDADQAAALVREVADIQVTARMKANK